MPTDIPPQGLAPKRRRTLRAGSGLPALALLVALLNPSLVLADGGEPPPSANTGWSWLDTLLEPLESLSHWVSGLFSRDERFVEGEIEHFKRIIDSDLSTFDGLVLQAGFRIASISVGAGLIPEIGLSMKFVRRVSEPEKATLMARITDDSGVVGTVQRSIIMTLLNAAESAYAVRVDGYRLTGVDIDIDVIPNVTFVMSKEP